LKKSILALALLIAVVASIAVIRTLRVPPPPEAAVAATPIPIDGARAAEHLAAAVRFATVSFASGAPIDTAQFLGLHQYFSETYPLVHSTLQRETVADLSLLYTWIGKDPTLPPLVLMGHMDVVPVPEESADRWTHDPFGGEIAEGYVWGRGALDDKMTVVALFEAVETLIQDGFQPERTVYLTFGHDEEVGGLYGAKPMVDLLASRGVAPVFVLDEGGMISESVAGMDLPAAIIGVAEKGYLSLGLVAEAAGGHSSMPPGESAVGVLSKAIAKVEGNPFPMHLDGPSRGMLEALAPYMPFGRRLVLSNFWLSGPFVKREMAKDPLGAALLRTTTAPTLLQAGVKDNVLPPRATGVVNFRIRPGETTETVTERVRRVINDERVTVSVYQGMAMEPTPVSDATGPEFGMLAETVRQAVGPADLPVIPYLVMGGTDAKYWAPLSDNVYRFMAITMRGNDFTRFHGVDERVGVEDFAGGVQFFAQLIRNSDRLAEAGSQQSDEGGSTIE